MAELEEEMAHLKAEASSGESKASLLDTSVQTAKDQLLRLNADFDNFRRRSVSVMNDQLAH